jgi:hypothetical protein
VLNLAFAGGTAALILAYGIILAVFFLEINPFARLLI